MTGACIACIACRAAGGIENLVSLLKALNAAAASDASRSLRTVLLSVLLALAVDEPNRVVAYSAGLVPVLVQLLSTKGDLVGHLHFLLASITHASCHHSNPSRKNSIMPKLSNTRFSAILWFKVCMHL